MSAVRCPFSFEIVRFVVRTKAKTLSDMSAASKSPRHHKSRKYFRPEQTLTVRHRSKSTETMKYSIPHPKIQPDCTMFQMKTEGIRHPRTMESCPSGPTAEAATCILLSVTGQETRPANAFLNRACEKWRKNCYLCDIKQTSYLWNSKEPSTK